MIDIQALGVELLDAFSYAISTALMIVGLCVVAVLAYQWASR